MSLFHKINTHILCYKNYEGKKQATLHEITIF